MDGGIHVACVSLEELFARDGDTPDAFGGRDGNAVRIALADYLARRLHTSIMTRVRGNVAIKATIVGHPCRCRGGGRGRGARTMPAATDWERTSCRVLLLSSRVGQMPTLEVILRASSVVASSLESATPATVPIYNGIQSVAASATRGAGEGRAKDMGGQPKRSLYGDPDEDPTHLRILPLPGEWDHVAADGTAANGAGTIEPPPAEYGVSPSHYMADQF